MRIAIVGTGSIGATLARKLSAAGHEVAISNSCGPETLERFAREIGATAAKVQDVAAGAEVLILSVPMSRMHELRPVVAGAPDDTALIDTSNYYPSRDGRIRDLDEGEVEALWVSRMLGHPVTKAWNAVLSGSLNDKGCSPGSPARIALPVAGDEAGPKAIASRLVEATGFDAVDAGGLGEAWRIQPGNPAFCTDLTTEQLKAALSHADREMAPQRRDLGIEAISLLGDHVSDDILHLYRALTKSPGRAVH